VESQITLYGSFLIVTQAQTWQHFSIPLRETAGWSDLLTGLPATSNQMMAVLSSLTVLDIRGEFGDGPATDIGGIDNVVLGPLVSGPVQVLPPQFYPSVAITGTVGSLYLIEYTNKLSTNRWIPLTSIVLPSSPYIFCDLTATNEPTRFYRAILDSYHRNQMPPNAALEPQPPRLAIINNDNKQRRDTLTTSIPKFVLALSQLLPPRTWPMPSSRTSRTMGLKCAGRHGSSS
jgi:hypothetical protein